MIRLVYSIHKNVYLVKGVRESDSWFVCKRVESLFRRNVLKIDMRLSLIGWLTPIAFSQ